MTVAITGGTGFVGTHLTRRLADAGHRVRVVARTPPERSLGERATFYSANVTDERALREAFDGCDAVAHLAGINRERGETTYERVHVEGTRAVVAAAEEDGVETLALTSFLRARPDCGSAYHESKWAAEELVRESALDHTVLKPGVVYGTGDHMIAHVSRGLATLPVFPAIGLSERRLRPLAVEDLIDVLVAALVGGQLRDATVAVVGPETVTLAEAVRRIGRAMGRDPIIVPVPVAAHYLGARIQEAVMARPVTARAQVRMLDEGMVDPAPAAVCEALPDDLTPGQAFTVERVAAALDDPQPYGLGDLRWPFG